jgi:preprotein translocase subunit SecD
MEIFVPQNDARRAIKILNDVLLAKHTDAAENAEASERQAAAMPRRKPIGTGVIVAIALLALGAVGLSISTKKVNTVAVRQPRTTKLEFVLIDDEHSIVDDASTFNTELPSGMRLEKEQVSLPPGRPVVREYARMVKAQGETLEAARARLDAWAKTLKLPAGDRVAYGEYQEYDDEQGKLVTIGWRTYLLTGAAILTEADVANAKAMPERDPNYPGWLVRLEFTADGAERFEKVTGENIKRRFAILLDGIVQSAPVIQTKIPGGIATITMGSADVEKQKIDAQNLEKTLNGY